MADDIIQVRDPYGIDGWASQVRTPLGANQPLDCSGITYAGQNPVTNAGATYRLMIKLLKDDLDEDAKVTIENVNLAFESNPLVVGYDLDTKAFPLVAGITYYGEFWVDDSTWGEHRVKYFQLKILPAIRKLFA